ncbi:hypothetical protein [Calidifontibacillus erzurumensis]|uniref:hypothetical protein n=1 Tax=Calidifontibacillus erzurumensis TaxID=2741433 RepID=UPI0018AD359D|nr:hypothetical protein [Calidifontibacillus erzurumensis]
MINFHKKEEWFIFYDNDGNKIERKTEVRFDPLTGESSRIIFDSKPPLTPPDYSEMAVKTGGAKCPFCPDNLLKMTPKFPKEIALDGRIMTGESVAFPNLFPYSKHNAVVIFSDDHYVTLKQFTVDMIKNAFMTAKIYIENVVESDQEARYASILWNYLPPSGGSILHPHIQPIVSDSPTNYLALVEEKAQQFEQEHGQEYFKALYETEKSLGERWIGEIGNVVWFHAFAPRGHNDFMAIFTKAHSIFEIGEEDLQHFAESLKAIFATLNEQGFASFNLMLNASIDRNSKQPVHIHLIPRFTIGMLETSDINSFQSLHNEPLSLKVPEEIAAKARVHFEKIRN